MNKNLLFGLITVIIIVGTGYLLVNNKNQAIQETPIIDNEAADSEAVVPTISDEFTITLAEQNASGESGTATLKEENGKVKVSLSLTGEPLDVTQPAHIHVGSCPDVGAVKYLLESPVNGVSETLLDVTLDQLRAEQPLGLNIHKSTSEASVYVSCGDLAL